MSAQQPIIELDGLSDSEVAAFHKNGFCGPYTLFSEQEMNACWKRERLSLFDRSRAAYPDVQPGTGVYDYDRHLDNGFLADVVCHPAIVSRVRSILGPDVNCWRSEFFPKYPGDGGTQWHQTDYFGCTNGVFHLQWPHGSQFRGALTVWIAFTDASIENSAMQFIPGTQGTMHYDESKEMHYDGVNVYREERNGIRRGFYGYDWRETQIDPNWEPDESQAVTIPCRAGEFLIFWSTTMHASTPHLGKSREMRLGFSGRYVPTAVSVYRNVDYVSELGGNFSLQNYGVVLVSGRDEYNLNRVRTHTLRNKPYVNSMPR